MKNASSTYKKGGVAIYIPQRSYGIRFETPAPYQFPKGHPCHGCPYTLGSSVPSCMFPQRRDGGCLWYDMKQRARPALSARAERQTGWKLWKFIEILKAVKRRKGFK